MLRTVTVIAVLLFVQAGAANAMNCNKVFDELMKAATGQLTSDMRVAIALGATRAYDSCMIGDVSSAKHTRDMIMAQVKKSLGGN